MNRWIACDGYDDGLIRFLFTGRAGGDQEIEYPGVLKHFTGRAVAAVEAGELKRLTLSKTDISTRQVSAEIARAAQE